MPEARTKDRVSRLLEMIVEEVSLVDRAANKRRFLIVKRSDGMDDTTNETAPVEGDINAPASDGDGLGGEPTASHEGTGAVGGDAPESSESLTAAVAALEGLTEAVELLGGQMHDEDGPRLAELAGELQTVAEKLAEAVGADSGTGTAGDDDGGGDGATSSSASPGVDDGADKPAAGDGDMPQAQGNRLAPAVESIRATLQRVSSALASSEKSATRVESTKAAEGDASSAKPSGGASGAEDAGSLKEQLGALITTLQTLTGTVKEQQQRLARLEKRFGLPNSQSAGEQAPRPGANASSWPMDLNQPVDRESVDKAISFHDL